MRLRHGVCVVLLAAGCTRSRRAPDGPPDVAIIYSSDLRGAVASPPHEPGGLARRATLVDRSRLSARAIVQVDAGDVAPSADDEPRATTPPGEAPLPQRGEALTARARLALRGYRRMGMDAVTVGERDLALGASTLRALYEETRTPVVAANLVGSDGRPLFPGERTVHAGEVTVGVFGILDLTGEPALAASDVKVTDPIAAARASVSALRAQGAQVIVGLFHVAGGGLARAREIVTAAPGADLVVLAHGPEGAAPAALPIVCAGARGTRIGRADVRLVPGGAPALHDAPIAVGADVPEQAGRHLLVRVAEGGPIAATFAESVKAIEKATGVRVFGEGWTYGSTALCEACHPTEAAQWKTTDHAHAFETLKHKGNDRDPNCMGCHMTGFLQPGGTQNFETATTQFTDVGCEACHGPSVAHVTSLDKRRGTSRKVDPVICLGCHTPDQNVGPFVVAAAMKEIIGPGHGLPAAGQH